MPKHRSVVPSDHCIQIHRPSTLSTTRHPSTFNDRPDDHPHPRPPPYNGEQTTVPASRAQDDDGERMGTQAYVEAPTCGEDSLQLQQQYRSLLQRRRLLFETARTGFAQPFARLLDEAGAKADREGVENVNFQYSAKVLGEGGSITWPWYWSVDVRDARAACWAAPPGVEPENGDTILMIALKTGMEDHAKYLIEHPGVDLFLKNSSGRDAASIAREYGRCGAESPGLLMHKYLHRKVPSHATHAAKKLRRTHGARNSRRHQRRNRSIVPHLLAIGQTMQDERDSEAQPSIAPMVFFETCKSPEAATTVFDAQEYSSERNRSGFLRRQVPDDEPEEDSADDEEPRVRSAERGGAAKNEEHFLCLVPVEKDVSCSSDVFPSLDGVHVSNLLGSDSSPGGSESGVGTPCARMPISPYLPNQREAGGKTMVCTAVQTDGEFPQNPKQNPKPEPKPLVIGENTKSNTQLTAVEHGLTNTRPSVNSGEPRPESPQADGGGMEITELAFSNNNLEYSGLVATIERASDVGSERRSADDHSGNMGDSVARAVVDDEVMEDELLASGSETYDDGAISPSAILQCSSEPKMGDTSTSGGIAGTVGNASAETGEHGADHSPTVLLFSAQRKMVDSTPGCCTTSAVDSASTDGVKERSSVQPTTVQADCNTLGRERGASEHENDHGDLRSGGYIGQKAVALDDDESIDIASPSLKCLTTVDEVTRDMQKMLREDAAQEDGSFDYLATFELFDVNGDGNVTVDELTSIFISLGMASQLPEAGISAVVARVPRDVSGRITKRELQAFAERRADLPWLRQAPAAAAICPINMGLSAVHHESLGNDTMPVEFVLAVSLHELQVKEVSPVGVFSWKKVPTDHSAVSLFVRITLHNSAAESAVVLADKQSMADGTAFTWTWRWDQTLVIPVSATTAKTDGQLLPRDSPRVIPTGHGNNAKEADRAGHAATTEGQESSTDNGSVLGNALKISVMDETWRVLSPPEEGTAATKKLAPAALSAGSISDDIDRNLVLIRDSIEIPATEAPTTCPFIGDGECQSQTVENGEDVDRSDGDSVNVTVSKVIKKGVSFWSPGRGRSEKPRGTESKSRGEHGTDIGSDDDGGSDTHEISQRSIESLSHAVSHEKVRWRKSPRPRKKNGVETEHLLVEVWEAKLPAHHPARVARTTAVDPSTRLESPLEKVDHEFTGNKEEVHEEMHADQCIGGDPLFRSKNQGQVSPRSVTVSRGASPSDCYDTGGVENKRESDVVEVGRESRNPSVAGSMLGRSEDNNQTPTTAPVRSMPPKRRGWFPSILKGKRRNNNNNNNNNNNSSSNEHDNHDGDDDGDKSNDNSSMKRKMAEAMLFPIPASDMIFEKADRTKTMNPLPSEGGGGEHRRSTEKTPSDCLWGRLEVSMLNVLTIGDRTAPSRGTRDERTSASVVEHNKTGPLSSGRETGLRKNSAPSVVKPVRDDDVTTKITPEDVGAAEEEGVGLEEVSSYAKVADAVWFGVEHPKGKRGKTKGRLRLAIQRFECSVPILDPLLTVDDANDPALSETQHSRIVGSIVTSSSSITGVENSASG